MKESHITAVMKDNSVHYGVVIERTDECFTITHDVSGTEVLALDEMIVASFDTMDDGECLVFESIKGTQI